MFYVVDSGLSSALEPLDNTTTDETKQMAGENYHIQSVLKPLNDFVIGGRTEYACHYFTQTSGAGRFNRLFHKRVILGHLFYGFVISFHQILV